MRSRSLLQILGWCGFFIPDTAILGVRNFVLGEKEADGM